MIRPNKELLNIQLASILNESPYSDRKVGLFFIHDFSFNANGLRITEELCSSYNPRTQKPFYDSLNGAPIVASFKGDDLGGHEPEFDADGNIIRLNTEGIGTLFNTYIGTHLINNEEKYGLWAEGYLWLRFQNTLDVIEELFSVDGRVDTSCEVSLGGFEFSEEGRTATKSILYFGHCLLGSRSQPAYADSGMYEFNLQVAEAYQKDIQSPSEEIKIDNEGGKNMVKKQVEVNEEKVTTEVVEDIKTTEIATEEIIEETKEEVAEDQNIDLATENEKLLSENNDLKEQLATKDTEISDLKSQIETLKSEISTKDESLKMTETEASEKIIKLGDSIEELKNQISALIPIKEEYDKVQAELQAKEIAEKQESLRQYALNSKLIEEKELSENEDIKKMIEELNESGIKVLIADRIVEKVKVETSTLETKTDDVIISSIKDKDLIPKSAKEKLYAEKE